MSYLTAEQVVAAHKANVETLFGLTQKAFEGVEKLVELNIQVAKTAMVEAADTTKAALSVKDAQELLALQQAMLQPAAEKAAAYGRHVYEIAASTNSEVAKVAESQLAEVRQQRFRDRAEGRQASHRRGRSQLPGHDQHGRQGHASPDPRPSRRLSLMTIAVAVAQSGPCRDRF